MVAYRAQGKPKPIAEMEGKPGTGEVTRGFFVSDEVHVSVSF